MHKETEKEFDEKFNLHGWPIVKLKSFISTNFIDKRVLKEQFEKIEIQWEGMPDDYKQALQDLKKKLL